MKIDKRGNTERRIRMAISKIFQYKHDYCPYCYAKMKRPTKYYCHVCNRDTETSEEHFNVDYRGIPVCTCGAGTMRIWCENERCRKATNVIPPEETSIVVVAGLTGSGKSTYLLDIINSNSNQSGVLVRPLSDQTLKWRFDEIGVVRGESDLESTETKDDNFSSVLNMSPRWKNSPLCISISNKPGEDSKNMARLLGLNYMNCADYIIFLLDLLNIPGITTELSAKGIQFLSADDMLHINALDTIIDVLEQKRGKYGRKIPLFIGVSKWDYIEAADLSPQGFSIGCTGPDTASILSAKGIDKAKLKNNSKIIRQFLLEHNEGNLVNTAEKYFKNVSYFAFSCFGTPPKIDSSTISNPVHNPRHIFDPFYSILSDMGKWKL